MKPTIPQVRARSRVEEEQRTERIHRKDCHHSPLFLSRRDRENILKNPKWIMLSQVVLLYALRASAVAINGVFLWVNQRSNHGATLIPAATVERQW